VPKKLDHNKIRRLIKEGKTKEEIAIETDCDERTIRRLASKWNVTIKQDLHGDEYSNRTINYLATIQHILGINNPMVNK
jgi:DNA invertase Pin-like site-specific DNA recombinase